MKKEKLYLTPQIYKGSHGTITNDMWINGQILKKVYSSMTESGWNGKYEKTNYQ